MKKKLLLATFAIIMILSLQSAAQQFSTAEYNSFRQGVLGITEVELAEMYSRPNEYYLKGFEDNPDIRNISYLDTVVTKLELTGDELDLLEQNMFFVTERLSYQNFGQAFHSVYNYDLPVFISTDAILHALHMSYDKILKTLEREIMSANLEMFLQSLYNNFDLLAQKYGHDELLNDGLSDADIYITIAYSLITDKLQECHVADQKEVQKIWDAICGEQLVSMPLFTFPERKRKLDFSQFKVRGHYVYTQQEEWMGLKSLEPYFRTMMWLGRTDFLLTPPPKNPWEQPWSDDEIQRMHYGAFMVNELIGNSDKLADFQFNEQVINYLVGESDNITLTEYNNIIQEEEINSAAMLTDSLTFQTVKAAFNSDPELGQKILSDFFLMDPNGDEPGVLPVSYRVSGQRFIIDSYVLGSVVFDKLMFNGEKVMRMMPKPLDALFTLGNSDVLPLLQDEFDKYPYAEQLANLRYLVDNKNPEFWSGSLYNVWLNSIRELNPAEEISGQPLFMKTAAWHQEKINTQLASWSHLRHDNLLYAKQSYTGGTGCSFPHSYIEPYPEFYRRLKQFAHVAGNFFNQLPVSNYSLTQIKKFFPNFESVMEQLEILADKELEGVSFSVEENEWLKSMLFLDGGSGRPPYSGWYSGLFFDVWDAAKGDFTIVDVHTQLTDEFGNIVGKVLHTGVGKVNLGVFVANCISNGNEQMAFVGPVMSYYEKITDNFLRLTDQDWEQNIAQNLLPERPDWTNIYLANSEGKARTAGTELPSKLYTGTVNISNQKLIITAYPNPVNDILTVSLTAKKDSRGEILLFNSMGTLVKSTGTNYFMRGRNNTQIAFAGMPDGFYLLKVMLEKNEAAVLKIIKQ
jgi:hypothetical protein